MTGERRDHQAKLWALIDIEGIDEVSRGLAVDLERVRAMQDGTGEIDAESSAWIDAEVLRLEAGGRRLEVPEVPEPEEIGPDDAIAEAPEPMVPDAEPHDVQVSREVLRAIAKCVIQLAGSFVDEEMETDLGLPHLGRTTPQYERAVAIVLRSRIMLQLKLRKPLDPGETDAARVRSIDDLKKRLRYFEGLFQNLGFRARHMFDGPFVWSGDSLYRDLVATCCAIRRIPNDLPIEIGVQGIGRFLYPEAYQERTPDLQRLDEEKQRLAKALIQAILIAEEASFASPLRREQELSSMYIVLHMELLLIIEVGVYPPFSDERRPHFSIPLRQMVWSAGRP